MRYWWVILFISSFAFTQQEIELCYDEVVTYTYYSTTNEPGYNQWEVGGQVFNTEELTMNWSDTGTYVLNLVRYNDGCPSEPISYVVVVKNCEKLVHWIPNSFTPDGNNINSEFIPILTYGFDTYNYHLIIYNRWGEIMFESYDHTKGWDGRYGNNICQDGVYTWVVEFKLATSNKRIVEYGHINLIK